MSQAQAMMQAIDEWTQYRENLIDELARLGEQEKADLRPYAETLATGALDIEKYPS